MEANKNAEKLEKNDCPEKFVTRIVKGLYKPLDEMKRTII